MSSQKAKDNIENMKFDDDSIESLKTYYKLVDSGETELYRFIKQNSTISDND